MWMQYAAAFAVTMFAFASYATPVQIISAERQLNLAMEDSVYVGDEPVRVYARLGPFTDSTTETGNFDSSFVGVIQTDQVDYQGTLIGEASQTSQISGDHVSYSGFVLGRMEPGLVSPDVYSGLEILTEGYYGGELGIVDGESTLDVLLEVQSVADFVFDFAWETWGDPEHGPRFSLENVDTGESIFWGLGSMCFIGGEYVDDSEDGGSLAGTLAPGNYAFSATIWSHWCPCSSEAPGGSLDLDLSFATPIPEPSTAPLLAFGLAGLAVGGRRRKRASSCNRIGRSRGTDAFSHLGGGARV